ncbi:MAG: hypothetical protein KKE39_08345 [Bacteroidetes bacterium]|nr:hypothetical protein [Bacteroidota bacterium]MBU1373592.1 hypothetical protein [Bacteroidota bacterium]MBU1486403.1 hypothetical protein [Bacteroidota bacterium]MBU1759640.1 hypothetical protein [Bacteroidota bacterium]MBU2045942.1 hypothetical protein [Bacteroidota bacterium]
MKKILYLSIVSIIIFAGCKKKNEPNPTKNEPNPTKVARLLKTYNIEISYNNSHRIDTMFMDNGVLLFTYNDNNQVVKIVDVYIPSHDSKETQIIYENNVPKRGYLISNTNIPSKTPEYVTNYDSIKFVTQNKLVNQIEFYNRTTKHFSFSPNGTFTEYSPNYKSIANVSYVNGNLTDFKNGKYEYKYEYGNKKSCGFNNKFDLAIINNHWKLLPILVSNNELLKVSVYNNGVLESSEEYTYTYNSEDYPITVTIKRYFLGGVSDIIGPVDIKYE